MEDDNKEPLIPYTRGERYRAKLDDAKEKLHGLEQELERINEEREAVIKQMERQKGIIEALEPVCSDLEEEEAVDRDAIWTDLAKAGIQECCYRVLAESEEPMTARGIKDRLEAVGIQMNQVNPLAVIHTSLKRIPERVRSFRHTVTGGGNLTTVRFYEVIREKKAGAAKPPKT